jgi:hypothetical protein
VTSRSEHASPLNFLVANEFKALFDNVLPTDVFGPAYLKESVARQPHNLVATVFSQRSNDFLFDSAVTHGSSFNRLLILKLVH